MTSWANVIKFNFVREFFLWYRKNIIISIKTPSPLSVCTKVTSPGRRLQISQRICECSRQLHRTGLGHDSTHHQGWLSMPPVPDELDSPTNKNTKSTTAQSNLTTGCIAAAHGRSVVFTRCRQCAPPPNSIIAWFFGPTKSKSQMASRLVQPFLHSSLQSVPILYNGSPFPPQKCPFPFGDLDRWTPI